MTDLREPLRFERHFVEKVWGGRALERSPGIALPPDTPVGETWEIVDREAENSVVREGGPVGATLRELVEAGARDLLGRASATPHGRFPLLVKYIDASDDLSVQVHPTDASAERLGAGYEGKTEAWYVLDAAPGAALYAGLRPGVTRAEFEREAAGPGVVDLLERWEARPGQCLLVPGGTVHAIGAGVTLLEVQQNSDTTFRVYDWGRMGLDGRPRETHLEEALQVVDYDLPRRPPASAVWEPVRAGLRRAPMARSRCFGMNLLELSDAVRLTTGRQFQVYAVLSGSGTLTMLGSGTAYTVSPGDTWLVPAAAGYHVLAPAGASLTLAQLLALP